MYQMSKSGSRKILLIVLVLAIIVVGIAAIVMTFYSSNFSMKLKGDEEMTVGLNAVYEDQGVKAVIDGRDVSDKVKVTGEVDTSKPGTYELKYSVEDLKAVRKVTVLDKMNPEIILEGSEKVDGLKLGDKFDEPGYKATDENGKGHNGQGEGGRQRYQKSRHEYRELYGERRQWKYHESDERGGGRSQYGLRRTGTSYLHVSLRL